MSEDKSEYIAGTDGEALLKAERAYLELTRYKRSGAEKGSNLPWAGIALSGGGIRSATFSLGVLQALVAKDLLKRFDFISSVSGGGYTASSLQYWWSKTRDRDDPIIVAGQRVIFGTLITDFPYGTAPPSPTKASTDSETQKTILSYLRSHGYYLTPGDGINAWSGFSVVLRTVLLSLIVWIPLLVLAFVILQTLDEFVLQPIVHAIVDATGRKLQDFQSPFASMFTNYWVCRNIAATPDYLRNCAFGLRLFYALILWGYLIVVAIFVLISIAFALLSRAGQETPKLLVRISRALASLTGGIICLFWATHAYYDYPEKQLPLIVLIILAILLGTVLFGQALVDLFRHRAINGSYFLRRSLERYFGFFFVPTLTLLVIGLIPAIPYFLIQYAAAKSVDLSAGGVATSVFGGISVVSGVVSGLYGYYTTVQKVVPGLAGRILAPIGAAVYLYGTILVAYVLAVIAFQALAYPDDFTIPGTLHDINLVRHIQTAVLVSISVAILVGAVASVNQIGLHRFYRDRLMEAFMPSREAIDRGRADYSPVADRLQLSDLAPTCDLKKTSEDLPLIPFPIINTLVTILNDPNRQLTNRGGDNFILTPLFLGCAATGWLRTRSYIDRYGPMTLASAMAASGAAVNSNAGYLGGGPTRNRLVSIVMTVLNMRLGLWIGNPSKWTRWSRVPTYFRPMLTSGLLGLGRAKTSSFLELSDGGNFDNLGLYELVRRKLSLIIVVDGEADSEVALPAFVSIAHRVQEDFGATISLVGGKGPERFVPVPLSSGATYPSKVSYASEPFLIGQVRYNDGTAGTLIYVKATLIKSIAFTTSGYRAEHADFPHQTTVDQFFDHDQFEAYRDLGFCSANLMVDLIDLPKLAEDPGKIFSTYATP